jgi:hypothetical protein
MQEIRGRPRVGSAGTVETRPPQLPRLLSSIDRWSHWTDAMGISGDSKCVWI